MLWSTVNSICKKSSEQVVQVLRICFGEDEENIFSSHHHLNYQSKFQSWTLMWFPNTCPRSSEIQTTILGILAGPKHGYLHEYLAWDNSGFALPDSDRSNICNDKFDWSIMSSQQRAFVSCHSRSLYTMDGPEVDRRKGESGEGNVVTPWTVHGGIIDFVWFGIKR